MNFEEAKELLNHSFRWELRDHAFGDTEFGWTDAKGNAIAEGYSGGGKCSIWFEDVGENFTCEDEAARELRNYGTLKIIERNDETGPDTYVEGYIMPGLTKEAVLNELITRGNDE